MDAMLRLTEGKKDRKKRPAMRSLQLHRQDNDGLEQALSEKSPNSECISNVELAGFPDTLNVGIRERTIMIPFFV